MKKKKLQEARKKLKAEKEVADEKKERDRQAKEMDDAISPSNGKSLAQDLSVMKAYSLAVATKADSSEPDEDSGFGTMTEAREAEEKDPMSGLDNYSVEKNEEE